MKELNTDKYEEIRGKRWEADTIEKIAAVRNLAVDDVKLMLKYNVVSFAQLSDLTAKSESQIRNDTIPRIRRNNTASVRLNICNPFPDTTKGKLFIHMDEKCTQYIMESLNV